jgi:hypothetical protein
MLPTDFGECPMTDRLPCFALRRLSLAILWLGLLAGLTAPDTPAAPPAPVAPLTRFTDNGNGTVTDGITGLIWLKVANCTGSPQPWGSALSFANRLANGNCGLADGSTAGQWRLPNRNELQSLVDYTRSPALPADFPFSGVQSGYYLSSTTYALNPSLAWGVYLVDGRVFALDKASNYYVWPVRGGQ